MHKRIISTFSILIFAMALMACQSTPHEEKVVDKSQGLAEECIIPVDDEVPKDFEVPEHWEETVTRSEEFITLKADYEINLPEIYSTPVYSYAPAPLTQERLEELSSYFSGDNKLYEVPAMTKAELLSEKEKLENRVGRWGRYTTDFSDMATVNEKMGRLEEAIEKAPNEEEEKTYIEPKFMVPYETEEEFVRDWGMRSIYAYNVNTDKEIGFAARVDKGQEVDPLIRAINYDSEVGSSTHFLYQQGLWMDENELEELLSNAEIRSNRMKEYYTPLKDAMGTMEDASFTEGHAIKVAKKILDDLSIENMEIYECVKAIGIPQSESWAGFHEIDKGIEAGYSVTVYPMCGDLAGLAMRRMVYDGLPENIYAPPYYTQKINIMITKDGIQRFEWTDISERTGIVAENTKLLTFSEIKEKLADHLLYEAMASLGEGAKEEGYGMQYEVLDVQLRSMYINAFEAPEAAWLIPVWVVQIKQDMLTPDGNALDLYTTTVILSAIDGGYVSVP